MKLILDHGDTDKPKKETKEEETILSPISARVSERLNERKKGRVIEKKRNNREISLCVCVCVCVSN